MVDKRLGQDGGLYAQLVDADVQHVYAHNTSDRTVQLRKGIGLGRLSRLDMDGAVQLPDACHAMAADQALLWQAPQGDLAVTDCQCDQRRAAIGRCMTHDTSERGVNMEACIQNTKDEKH
jgi:hypothetical protein